MAKDLCIICGNETAYDFNTHIDYRVGYVEGSGQLCVSCHQGKSEKISLVIRVEEDVILHTPNDFELGEKIRRMYYNAKNNS